MRDNETIIETLQTELNIPNDYAKVLVEKYKTQIEDELERGSTPYQTACRLIDNENSEE